MALKPWAKPSFVENDSGVLMPAEQALYVTSEDSSVTLTYTDLPPANDPAGVGATQLDLKAAGGGGGLQLGTDGWWGVDNVTQVPMDGSHHGLDTTMTNPPAWFDGVRNITEEGIYGVLTSVHGPSTPPTTSGLKIAVLGYQASWVNDWEDLSTGLFPGLQQLGLLELQVVYQVPWDIAIGGYGQPDATGVIPMTVYLAQFAH